ncbi:MAG: hypothetical protein IJG81_01000 [Muribaculaceae bacterium]|nr:hypothetical protein [Muribaculaceae bacterium]
MKKIFTLFAAAFVGLCAFAQDPCPTVPELTLLNGDDAANVEIELGLKENNSANLNGFNFELTKPHDATWKRAQGMNWFSAKGYAPYILGMLNQNMGTEFTNEELEDMLSDLCDVKSNAKTVGEEKNLVIIEILSTNDCRFFPQAPGKVGKFKIDMSALADGEYEIKAENTPETASMSYTGGVEGTRAWTIDEPLTITLNKTGDAVTQVVDAISTITIDQPVDNRIFDLQGRQLQSVPEHGIYIQNGKKYVK